MARDIIDELKSNPRILVGGLFIIAFVVTISAYYFKDNKSSKKTLSLETTASLIPAEGLPSDFYEPFPVVKKILPPPPPPPKEKEQIAYNLNDLMTIKAKQPVNVSEEEILRLELLSKRRKKGLVRVAEKRKEGRGFNYKTVYTDESRDVDFGAHDLAKSIATFPVDLSRTLTADRFISAVLYTEVKSELPSEKVIAMVDQDVFAAHGRKILIPKGSKVIGAYEPLDEQGAQRLQISWYRIITTNGIDIKLDSETADQLGATGVAGKVDNRWKDRYGTALLFSSLSALAQLSIDTDSEAQSSASESLSSEFGGVTAESFRAGLDVLPRVTIERGSRLNISPKTDIWFKPPVLGQSRVIPTKEFELGGRYSEQRFQYQNPSQFQLNQNSEDVDRFAAIRDMRKPLTVSDLPQYRDFKPLPMGAVSDKDEMEEFFKNSLNNKDFPLESNNNNNERESLREISDAEFHEMIIKH
jgi:type IV secretory pathway VirB10-like protein